MFHAGGQASGVWN